MYMSNGINDEDKSAPSGDALKRLKKRLYKKEGKFGGRYRAPELSYKPEKVLGGWKPEQKTKPKFDLDPRMRRIILISAVAVFVIFVGAMVYIFGGFGTISSQNVEIEIIGPTSVNGGELAHWDVVVRNKNDVPLLSSSIIFDYPQNSKPTSELTKGLLQHRRSLGTVRPNETVRESFEAFMFGEEGTKGSVRAAFEYRPEGSNAILAKEETSEIAILSSSLGINVKMPEEVRVNQEVNIEVEYTSNAAAILENIFLEMAFPDGFTLIAASPNPIDNNNNRWRIGDLNPGQKGMIRLVGRIEGEDLESKSIHALAGIIQNGELNIYGGAVSTFALKQPYLSIDILANDKKDPVLRPGELANVVVSWRNNLPVRVSDLSIEVEITGNAVDESSITVDQGFYRGVDKKIVWNASTVPEFQFVQPGARGEVRFQFNAFDAPASWQVGDNFSAKLNGVIKSINAPAGFEGTDITGHAVAEMKVQSALQLVQKEFYYYDPLPGYGPLPPKVGQETIYTVVWSLANSFNDLENVVVKTNLPAYMVWKNNFLPDNANLTYDPKRGEVIWNVGGLEAGAGLVRPAKEATFQIGLLASADQVGRSPTMLLQTTAEGVDEFTGNLVRDTEPATEITLRDDPRVVSTQTEVAP